MRFSALLLAFFMTGISAPAWAASSSYVDEKGTRHFVSGPEEIPAKYRNPERLSPPPAPAPPPAPPPPAAAESVPETPTRSGLLQRREKALAGSCPQEEKKICFRVSADDCADRIHAMAASCAAIDPIKGFPEKLPDTNSATQLGVLFTTCVWMKYIGEAKAKGQAEATPQCEGLYRLLTLDHAALVAGSEAEAKPSAPVKPDRPPIDYMFAGSARFDADDLEGARVLYEKALAANEVAKQLKGEALAMLYSNLADCYFFQNKFPEAIRLMKQALAEAKMAPSKIAHNHFNLACAQSMLGSQAEAAAELRLTIEGVKGSPELLSKYSRMARTDEQLTKLRSTDAFSKLAKELGF